MRRDIGLVGHHDHGLSVTGEVAEDPHDLLRRRRIEIARWLVGEQNRRAVDECPGDRDALPLAAGELVGPMQHAIAELNRLEGFDGAGATLGGRHAGVDEGQLDVVQSGCSAPAD